MPSRSGTVVAAVERCLRAAGGSGRSLAGPLRELADHHEDLRLAALAQGCTEAEAEALADARLGEPTDLARQWAAVLRQASWWGRHPWLGFGILPPVAFLLVWCLVGAGVVAAGGLGLWLRHVGGFSAGDLATAFLAEPEAFAEVYAVPAGVNTAALALVVLGFGRLARRALLGPRWLALAGLVTAGQGFFLQNGLEPHRFNFGYGWPPNWAGAAIPLLVAGLLVAEWAVRRRGVRVVAGPLVGWPLTWRVTPTLVGFALLAALVLGLGLRLREAAGRRAARLEWLRREVWPAERAAAVEELRRGHAPITRLATPVELAPWVNAALADSVPGDPAGGNHLASLPAGLHVFAGVPFLIDGRVQLLGRDLPPHFPAWPTRVREIPIGRHCGNLHLLHGAAYSAAQPVPPGTVVGRLVIRYADQSTAELPMVAGAQVLNWWGPVFTTEAPAGERRPSAPGTTLAWAGVNPAIRKAVPDYSLRLYRTTFANPHPEAWIVSIDYASAVTGAAPFLLGLTVE